MVVLVLGGSGQVGQALKSIANHYPEITFVFTYSKDADVRSINDLRLIFEVHQPKYCINAAAYTAVEAAEMNTSYAFEVNAIGAANVAEVCKQHNVTLLQLSTDYVFDGSKQYPYTEDDETNPQTVYGQSKLRGEHYIQSCFEKYFIIRTSWVYSNFGKNFLLTVLKLAEQNQFVHVVNDQIGSPTHAIELSRVLVQIIKSGSPNYGIYHYSSEGVATWFDFASEIFKINQKSVKLKPVSSDFFGSSTPRPKYSVLDKSKIRGMFQIDIPDWKSTLIRHS